MLSSVRKRLDGFPGEGIKKNLGANTILLRYLHLSALGFDWSQFRQSPPSGMPICPSTFPSPGIGEWHMVQPAHLHRHSPFTLALSSFISYATAVPLECITTISTLPLPHPYIKTQLLWPWQQLHYRRISPPQIVSHNDEQNSS